MTFMFFWVEAVMMVMMLMSTGAVSSGDDCADWDLDCGSGGDCVFTGVVSSGDDCGDGVQWW